MAKVLGSGGDTMGLMFGFPKKVSQCMRMFAMSYLEDSRIKPQHLMVVHRIGCSEGGISQKELNEDIPFDKSYISTMVHDLIEMGYLSNEGSGKTHSLYLTDNGRDIFVISRMMFDLLDTNLFQVLEEEDIESLKRIMTRLDARLDAIMSDLSERNANS